MNYAPPLTNIVPQANGGMPPAAPVVFDGLAGFYHAASGDTAVLLLSPWGYEELSARKTFRLLGEGLAAAGFPCLRFDYPATGHSAGDSSALEDEQGWRSSAKRALEELRALASPRRIIVIGQGIGGALAGELARNTELDGLVLMAPVADGRVYLRELAAWTAMTKPTFLVDASDGPEGGLMSGGFVLSAATRQEVRALNLARDWMPKAERILLVERDNHGGDKILAEALDGSGYKPDRLRFDGYADYVSDPTLSAVPAKVISEIVRWCSSNFGSSHQTPAIHAAGPAILREQGYEETLVRFGPDQMFFGAFTKPAGTPAKTAVVFLNSGYDHSIGWGRMTVDFCRALAREGYAAFRFDAAGIGESRLWPGQAPQVLYSARQADDVRFAVDWLLEGSSIENVILAGRCSGAYLTGVVAEADRRISGAVIINPRRLAWDRTDDIDKILALPVRELETYKRKLFDPQTLKRLAKGELAVGKAARKLTRALMRRMDRKLAPILGDASYHGRLVGITRNRFGTLKERATPVRLIYADEDHGPRDLEAMFGDKRERLSHYPNVEVTFLSPADHNLSPLAARERVLNIIRGLARQIEG